ncbi:hypothetical protein B0H19DRAFT_1245897 [Mycena capillaripes]|nr:hypothetical protein B0H19DRAFT_1245897 [Mycena capillaripes]
MSHGHKRKANGPQLVVHGTPSAISSHSGDNRRQRTTLGVVLQDAGPSAGVSSQYWADDLAANAGRLAEDFTYRLGDNSLESQYDHQFDDGTSLQDGITVVIQNIVHDQNSDRPLQTWYPQEDTYVEEQLWHKGRSVERKWDAQKKMFVHKRTWLKELGLRVQLGRHPPGAVCTFRYSAQSDFVLYDLTGVHQINMDFCGCLPRIEPHIQLQRVCWWPATVLMPNTCATFAALQLFQVVNCLGKLSAYNFLRGLEICTNHDSLDKPPDRRKPFMHIRGHAAGGVRATQQGELALMCQQCPQPKWNLPEDWDKIDPLYRFIYFMFLAVDANFRLSNRNVSSEVTDPIFGDGLDYFCKREGEDRYKAHIEKHVNQQEISTCSGFQAMFLTNAKCVKGLRTTGIGSVTCSRHNMWQGNGIGDLQIGERYCNMDFLVQAVLMALNILWVIISYDIACQYAIHFWDRMSKFADDKELPFKSKNVWWKVPNFHLPPHKKPCHSPYSFHWMWGARMTHGEGVEQNWSFSNGAAASTRLMGPRSCHATLKDVFGFHNYDCMLAMHRVLPKRLVVNIKEGLKHRVAFDVFNAGLEALRPQEVAQWRASVMRWESKQHTNPSESPFKLMEDEGAVITLRKIQLDIATEEFICTDDGVEVERDHSPGSFITTGLELKDVQRRLEIDVRALKDPTPTQKLAFLKRRTALLKQIHKFRQVQRVYMPALRGILTDAQRQMFDRNGEQVPEATRLFMPSEIPNRGLRGKICAIGLPEVEARMCMGEATEALEGVRQGLRTRTMTNHFRLRNYTGQGMMTKGQGILRQINIKIHICKLRHCYSRSALLTLRDHGDWEKDLHVLRDEDVRTLNERALTEEEKAQNAHWAEPGGAIIEGGIARALGLAGGEGAHTLSWIWYTIGVQRDGDEDDPRFYDALRVEWCKAYARAKHYSEDVQHLQEEMRRRLAFGEMAAAKWDTLVEEELPDYSAELTEGRRAYAAEHADTECRTCSHLRTLWAPILRRADAYLEGTLDVEADMVTVQMDIGDELEADEEEALLEGDEG